MQTPIHNEAELWATTAAAGGLTEAELKAWNDHVATCPGCRKLYEEELAMNKLVKEALHPECPDSGFERRMISNFRQVHARKETRWRDFFHPAPILVGAAACAALIALAGIGSQMKTEKPVVARSVIPGVNLQALPAAVQQTIQSNSDGRTISSIERTDDDGEVSYDVTTKSGDGEEWDLTVADDGTLLSTDIAPTELPSVVQMALKTQMGNGTLEGVTKQFDDGEITYEAGIKAPNGEERDFTYAENGTLASEEVNLTELPLPVQTAIDAQVGQGKLEGIDKTYDDGEITYEATMTTPAGQDRNFSISSEGSLLSREASLQEVPAPVKETISQKLGQGKVVEIDQSFDAENQATPYEIESEKGGKAFDFMISPTGRFLGMEE